MRRHKTGVRCFLRPGWRTQRVILILEHGVVESINVTYLSVLWNPVRRVLQFALQTHVFHGLTDTHSIEEARRFRFANV